MLRIAHFGLEKAESASRRRLSAFSVDAFDSQRAEEPKLAGLQREKFFAGQRELAVAQRFQVTAVGFIDASGQVKIDEALAKDFAATPRLTEQLLAGGRHCRGASGRFGGGNGCGANDEKNSQNKTDIEATKGCH